MTVRVLVNGKEVARIHTTDPKEAALLNDRHARAVRCPQWPISTGVAYLRKT